MIIDTILTIFLEFGFSKYYKNNIKLLNIMKFLIILGDIVLLVKSKSIQKARVGSGIDLVSGEGRVCLHKCDRSEP